MTVQVCLVALVLLAVHCSVAVVIPSNQEQTTSEWVHHLRIGDVLFAKATDKKQMSDYLREMSYHDDGTACFGSASSNVAEDGPLVSQLEKSREKRDFIYEDYDTQSYKCLKEVDRVFYYPEFAVGALDNGCTAFLVGPYHAITTAKCVYDFSNRLWEKKLDFLRAKSGSEYLQRMEWEEVYVPRKFFDQNNEDFDWALILFNTSQPSSVWHPFMYCPSKCPGPYSTTYGYKNETMILKECEILEQKCHNRFEMQCCQNNAANFHGGPVFNGYSFDGSQVPPVVGMNTLAANKAETDSSELEPKTSPNDEEIIFDTAMKFNSEMFWTVCMLMENSGYDSNCMKL